VSVPALDVVGLDVGYGRSTVLRDVSVTVPAGSVTALVGPNGAGKTTLLRTISGFLAPTRGRISLFGEDITTLSAHRRFERGLCHVPEGRGVFRSLTVRDNLIMQSRRGHEREALEKAVTSFPILGERIRQVAGTLSGGEQQMLAMAAAYVRDSSVILVDEASLGLAPLVVDAIFGFLERVSGDGTSLLIVDQFVTRALAMASTAYVLRQGSVVYSGPADRLADTDVFSSYIGAG
jgi:branched-chain amino acid transport system ATP-binding protein